MRRVMTMVCMTLGVLGFAVGVPTLVWAYNREYADNQRNWAFVLGFVGIVGGIFMLGLASVLAPPGRP